METFEFDERFTTVRLPELIESSFGSTRSEARRLLRDGAVKIDGQKIGDLTCAAMDVDGKVLQVGKRRFARIRLQFA